jgi:hypothetical protein
MNWSGLSHDLYSFLNSDSDDDIDGLNSKRSKVKIKMRLPAFFWEV